MATYKHIRSSTAHKRPTTSIADGQLAINTNTASPGLFFKDSAGTGIVKVGPVHVGTTAPNSSPATGGSTGNYLGEQWLDTSVSPAQMKVWNGSAWVGIVADELPVSKLQDGAARQLIQTDAAGTGVEWTSNVDVPGTLDVTSTATFDSIASHPLGSAGAPTITFTGDNNTGIYSPGADQLALSTNGTGRLFVDASGNIGVGTAPSQLLHIAGASATALVAASSGTGAVQITRGATAFEAGTTSSVAYIGTTSATDFQLRTGGTEKLRITSAGLVGIGTSSVSNKLEVYSNTDNSAIAPNSDISGLTITNASATVDSYTGLLLRSYGGTDSVYLRAIAKANNQIDFEIGGQTSGQASAAPRLTIDSSGRVGIGTTSPLSTFDVKPSSDRHVLVTSNASYANNGIVATNDAGSEIALGIGGTPIQFFTGAAERARIDSSGRLLVGTSSSVGSRELQLVSGFSANQNRSSSFAKSLALSDNVSTTYFTLAIPAFVDFADVLSVGVEVSYVVTAHRQTSGRGATATYGKVYLAISRYWESSTVAPIVTALTTTDQALAFADQGFDPTITWAVSQDAGTDQAAKNVYLSITVDNTAPGTVVQRVDGTAAMNYYTTRGVIGIS